MRLFTVAEANALLPQLRRLFDAVDEARAVLTQMEPEAKRASQQQGGGGVTQGATYARALTNFIGNVQEILSYGIEIKDFEQGLCDFPHDRDGQIVYLCWRRGEARIEWWHEIEAGFAGRQPLDDPLD